ncbi:MAG: hypothetical protein ACLFTZ_04000, partial [Acholeplasmataceae bacterium]
MKKLFVLLLLLVATFALVSCRDQDPELESPADVTITDGILTWNAVDDADGYLVVVGTDEHEVTETTFDLNALDLAAGTYNVTVSSVAGDSVSTPSAVLEFVVEEETPDQLDAPTGLSIDDNVLSWDAVSGATRYEVAIGDEVYATTEANFDLSSLFLSPGSYDVSVTARSGERSSDGSAVLNHVIAESLDQEVVVSSILETMNPAYTPGMEKTDFAVESDYEQYVQMTAIVETYVTAAANSQMTEENAVGLFAEVYTMPMTMSSVVDLSGLMDEMDDLSDYDVTTEELVYMLMELLMTVLDLSEESLTEVHAEIEAGIDVDAVIAAAFADPDFAELHQSFEENLPSQYQDRFDSMFTADYEGEAYLALNLVSIMAYDIYYDTAPEDPYYLNDENPYSYMFYDTLQNAYDNGDTDFLENLANDYDHLDPFYDLRDQLDGFRELSLQAEQIEMQIELIVDLREAILEEPDMFEESLEGVFDYLFLVYDSVTPLLISTVDSTVEEGYATVEETMIIKDEVVSILQDTLPDPEDFTNLFLMFSYLGGEIGELDMTDYTAEAETIGQYNYESLDLALSILGDFDQTTFEEILELTEGLYTPPYDIYDPLTESYDTYPAEIDYSKLVELLVFVGNYWRSVEATYASEIASIEALADESFSNEANLEMLEMILAELEGQMPDEDYEMLEDLIEAISADLDDIEAGLEIFDTISEELVDEFLMSEGAFFQLLIEFNENGSDDPAEDVLALLEYFSAYNDALLIGNDQETIEAFLDVFRAPLGVALGDSFGPGEFDSLFDELAPPIAEVINDIATLEQLLLDAAIDIDAPALYYDGLDDLSDDDMRDAVIAILILDEAISDGNEELIPDTIDTLFADILSNETVMMGLEMDQEMLDALYFQTADSVAMILD